MFPLKNLTVFTLVLLESVIESPLQQTERHSCSTYLDFELYAEEQGRPEKEASSSVVNVMQGVTQQLRKGSVKICMEKECTKHVIIMYLHVTVCKFYVICM